MANSIEKLRVFVDANILFSGSAFPRWPYEILQHGLSKDFKLILCPLVIDSARRHLKKDFPKQLDRFEIFLHKVEYDLVSDPSKDEIESNSRLCRDLSDVPIALAAIAANVNYLVSEDKDLTVMDKSTEELRRHVKPLISGTFLREVMGWTSEELEKIRYRKWSDMDARGESGTDAKNW